MTDELKQWEYDKGYTKGYSDGRASLIEELEKIICELRNCYPSMPIFNKREWGEENKAYLDCESIIFKHISELKGENNGETTE